MQRSSLHVEDAPIPYLPCLGIAATTRSSRTKIECPGSNRFVTKRACCCRCAAPREEQRLAREAPRVTVKDPLLTPDWPITIDAVNSCSLL